MTKTFIIENGQKPTEEQLKEIEEAQKNPIVLDNDCEELSPAMMKAFRSAVVQRNRKKKAQGFSLLKYRIVRSTFRRRNAERDVNGQIFREKLVEKDMLENTKLYQELQKRESETPDRYRKNFL